MLATVLNQSYLKKAIIIDFKYPNLPGPKCCKYFNYKSTGQYGINIRVTNELEQKKIGFLDLRKFCQGFSILPKIDSSLVPFLS